MELEVREFCEKIQAVLDDAPVNDKEFIRILQRHCDRVNNPYANNMFGDQTRRLRQCEIKAVLSGFKNLTKILKTESASEG